MKLEKKCEKMTVLELKCAESYFKNPQNFVLCNALKIFMRTKSTLVQLIALKILERGANWL